MEITGLFESNLLFQVFVLLGVYTIIAFIIFVAIMSSWHFIIWFWRRYLFFSSEFAIKIHEAGHFLMFLRGYNNKNDRNFKHELRRLNCLAVNARGGFLHIETKRTERLRQILMGGLAMELRYRNKHLTRWTFYKHKYLYGCYSDLEKLHIIYKMSTKDIITAINAQIDSITETDMEYIDEVLHQFNIRHARPTKYSNQDMVVIPKDALFKLALSYRNI